MSKTDNFRERFLYVYIMLCDRPVSRRQIQETLSRRYGIETDKKTIWNDLFAIDRVFPITITKQGNVPFYHIEVKR